MIDKLAELANELDDSGAHDLADRIDSVIDDLYKAASDGGKQKKFPGWVAAATEAMPLLDQAIAIFVKHMASDANLEHAHKQMKLILEQNKTK